MRPSKPGEPLFPVRPDEPVCSYYMKHGTCKFGQTCKFNHPPQPKQAIVGDALPQQPDEPDCIYFLRNGRCKYGPTCKYHHPLDGRRRSLSGSSDGTSQYYNGAHSANGQNTKLFVTDSGSQVMMVGRGGGGYDGYGRPYSYGPPPPTGVGSPLMTPMGVVSVPSSYETASSQGMGSYPGEGWYGEGGATQTDANSQGLPSLYPPAPTSTSAFSSGTGSKTGVEGKWSSKFVAHSTTNSTASISSHGTSSPLGELSPTSAPWEGNISSVPPVPSSRHSSTSARNSGGDGGVTPVFSNETTTVNTNSTWSVDGSPSLAPSSESCTDIDSKDDAEGGNFDQGINNMTSALLDILDFSSEGGGESNKGSSASGPQHLLQGGNRPGLGPGQGGPEGPPPMAYQQMHQQNQGPRQFVNMQPQYGLHQRQQQQQQQQNKFGNGNHPQHLQQQQNMYFQHQQQQMRMHGHPPLHPGVNHIEEQQHPVPPFKRGPGGSLGGNIFETGGGVGPPPIPQAPPTWAAQVMGGQRG